MAFTPDSEVRLLNVPLENDYKNQIYFANRGDQSTYFSSKVVHTYNNLTYQRKDNIIRVPEHIDNLYNCNYVMYRNTRYNNKWFYAFITRMEYINDGTTHVYIETDVYQTWLTEVTLKKSFVEREHVMDDTIGLHTIPETLETGEYICNELVRDNELSELSYIIMVTEWTNSTEDNPNIPLATNFGGIFGGYGAYICKTMREVVNIIQTYQEGKKDAVIGVYMVPSKIIKEDEDDGTLQFSGQSKPVTYTHEFNKQTTLDGYTPKNNKVLCYPYNYILNSNNSGVSNILQYEHFSSDKCEFEICGVPVVGGSIKCTPKNYKGVERIQEEGIMCGKFPTLSWSEDLFTNWLTQNAVNLNTGIATSGASIIVGLGMMATGNVVVGGGMVAGGVMGIHNTMSQIHQHSFTPNSARGNTNGGDINTSYDMNKFYFYKMSIKKEYAEKIDNFFEMFGYKVNSLKVPNVSGRPHWNYVKTIDVNIDGAIPNEDMQKLKSMYDNGVTFWKNGANVGNYSLDNH